MGGRSLGTWLGWTLLAAPIALASAGCFLIPSAPRPDPNAPIAGPVPYVDNCQLCHASPVAAHYAMSLHTTKGIRCGQCHTPGGHPNFTQPIRDGKCGGCHQPQYQESLASTHFATRAQRALDHDQAAPKALRQEGFTARAPGGGGASWGIVLGGARRPPVRRVSLRRASPRPRRRAAGGFCASCHGARPTISTSPFPSGTNRCLQCHVRVGETATGQVVNSHRFARPGAEGSGK